MCLYYVPAFLLFCSNCQLLSPCVSAYVTSFSWKYGMLKVSAAFCMLLSIIEHYRVFHFFGRFHVFPQWFSDLCDRRSTVFMVVCVVSMILPWCCPISDDMFVLFSTFLLFCSLCLCLCVFFSWKYKLFKVTARDWMNWTDFENAAW